MPSGEMAVRKMLNQTPLSVPPMSRCLGHLGLGSCTCHTSLNACLAPLLDYCELQNESGSAVPQTRPSYHKTRREPSRALQTFFRRSQRVNPAATFLFTKSATDIMFEQCCSCSQALFWMPPARLAGVEFHVPANAYWLCCEDTIIHAVMFVLE